MTQETHKEQCASCAAAGGDTVGNNRSVYDDGSHYCWACGDTKSNAAVSKEAGVVAVPKKINKISDLIPGIVSEIPERGIDKETCQKYNVRIGNMNQKEFIIYPIYKNGSVVKQKLRNRTAKSDQTQRGDTSCMALFGQNIFNPSKNIPIAITEGEYDAMAIYQATKYPAVSGVRGAQGLVKELKANMEWLSQWKSITLCLDNDEEGERAVKAIVDEFEPGTVRVARLPLKDANDMLMAGRQEEIKRNLFDAGVIKPATLVTVTDILDKVLEKPKFGEKWPWPSMTKMTYGLRWGEVFLLAAATSVGKTEFLREIVSQQLDNDIPVGLFSLEQSPEDTVRRFVGARLNKRLHIPGAEWNEGQIRKEIVKIEDKLVLYNGKSGMLSLDQIMINMRFANKCYNTKFFVLDNLKALAINPIIEGKPVPQIQFMAYTMGQMSRLAKELGVTVFVITHVNTDKISLSYKMGEEIDPKTADGLRWETGRIPTLENIYGGGQISDLVDYVIVLARNRVSNDKLKHRRTIVKFLKTRLDSAFEGSTFSLLYDYETGKLNEETNPLI